MQKRSSGGCGSFLFLLFFAFLALKLAGAIEWSWWWVTSPLWLPAALALGALALLAVTGVSIYKIVARLLSRQSAPPGDRPQADVLEAEGSEVRMPSSDTKQPLSLPSGTVTPDDPGAATGGRSSAP